MLCQPTGRRGAPHVGTRSPRRTRCKEKPPTLPGPGGPCGRAQFSKNPPAGPCLYGVKSSDTTPSGLKTLVAYRLSARPKTRFLLKLSAVAFSDHWRVCDTNVGDMG